MCHDLEEGSKNVVPRNLVLKEEHAENKHELEVHECVLQPFPNVVELSFIRPVLLHVIDVGDSKAYHYDDNV